MKTRVWNVGMGWLLVLVWLVWMGGGCSSTAVIPTKEAATSPPPSQVRSINGIFAQTEQGRSRVRIQSTAPLTYTSVKQPGHPGVSLYFPGTLLGDVPNEIPGDGSAVVRIVTQKIEADPPTARIDIDLSMDVPYEILKQDEGLDVLFETASETKPMVAGGGTSGGRKTGVDVQPPASEIRSQQNTTEALLRSTQTQTASDASAIRRPKKIAWLERIDFVAGDTGEATMTLGTTEPVSYRVERLNPTQIRLLLEHTRISEHRNYPLVTNRFKGAVNRIVPTQAPKAPDTTWVTIDLRENVPFRVEQNGTLLLVHFDPSKTTPEQILPPAFREEPLASVQPAAEPGLTAKPALAPSQMVTSAVVSERKRSDLYRGDIPKVYTGEKIAIDFFDTDIRNVFKIIAEISGKNFAIDPNVTGKVTLSFDKPVPWDQVLDIVLRMNQLDKVEEGDIVRIATLAQLQKEEEGKKKLMIAEKESQNQLVELEPLVTEYLPINYAKAADEMKPHLDGLLTPGRGTLTVDSRTNQLIMTDVPAKIRKAKEIIQKLDRVTPQVVIEAKIVEASTDFARDLGVTWDAMGGIQGTDARAGIGPQRGFDVLNGTYGWDAAVNFPIASANNGQIGINFTKIAGTPLVINAKLYAMEQNNQGRIISSPKILTMDNKEAFIEQGVEVGYTEKGKTDEVPSVKFKKVTLNLKVTPHVTLDHRISMKIELVKDDILSYFQGVPIINTKKTATELLVDDGDTLVIGGITKTSEKETESGVPGLSKIPLLGWLFKTRSNVRANEELLIFMTPRIVQLEQRSMITQTNG
uniref:Type IV pilus secretin PilQ n=1 Tax=Desulfatirhabdium butyrativorans TaxID=340467 RepID=A0A7C4MM94_9BACT